MKHHLDQLNYDTWRVEKCHSKMLPSFKLT